MRDLTGADVEVARTCTLLELDVTDAAALTHAVVQIVDREGRIDAVVNNAGYVLWGPVEETPVESIQREFDVNVFGAVRVIRAVLPVMRRQRRGVVVQMSSISGRVVAGPFWGHYAASKFALEALSEALAYELEPFGIRVVIIEPGSYDTTIANSIELSPGLGEGSSPYDAAYRRMQSVEEPWPLGDPQEVPELWFAQSKAKRHHSASSSAKMPRGTSTPDRTATRRTGGRSGSSGN